MSAPENSNSKVPPSLLSDKAKGADGNGSRILANLEGRVASPADKPRRSRTPLALVALLVIAAGGWGAWRMQQRGQNEPLAAAVPASAVTIAKAAVPASAASAAAQVGANAQAAEPASSQAATIITDESESKAAAASPASAGTAESRLSRALAGGAEPGSASTPVAAVASAGASGAAGASNSAATRAASAVRHDKSSAVASRSKHEAAARSKKENATATASNHRSGTTTASAQSKKAKPDASSKDDSDADLLAALVARTKPAETKGGSSNPATRVATAAVPGNAKLAERVKECGQRGFFEDQLCRWRVCDGHWGKDPACPGSSPQTRQP
ncbi:hypothetical protein [Burkholderia sp. WSM2230]|uniref:hypothetical protein n=1 Tax=Burkholderia sp. WSM2230 TaxID=944435 RepID=UPI0004195053|nr:hypothetical protein [Burkholderia sp. WSM2230]